MSKYPTGVEAHGESLRIWFMLNGKRERESLGVPDTHKNRKIAGELRASICYAIKIGTFDYAKQFPSSQKFKTLNQVNRSITLKELASIWLNLKEMEITKNAHNRYCSYINVCNSLLGENREIYSINLEKIMSLRRELLLGAQISGAHQKNRNLKVGRSVRTVNVYITCFKNMLEFACINGYLEKNPANSIKPLKKEKSDPDPLTKEEYLRLLAACKNEQTHNMWVFAINTGMRHGEISALCWEDIDTKRWEVSVNRNMAVKDHFTPPKTESGVRVISLTTPAIKALKQQMALTKMGKTHKIKVNLREYGKIRIDDCTFVFSPILSSNNSTGGAYYSAGSIGATWNAAIKRSGIRHRKAYESRHTYACWALSSGANPSFIANQMGHTSAQMIYSVYGKWMSDKNDSQLALLNQSFEENAPLMPQEQKAKQFNT